MNYKLKLHRDDDPPDPRENDNLGRMVCFHSRYNLGDVQPRSDAQEWLRDLACELDSGLWERLDYWENGNGWQALANKADAAAAATTERALVKAEAAADRFEAVSLAVRRAEADDTVPDELQDEWKTAYYANETAKSEYRLARSEESHRSWKMSSAASEVKIEAAVQKVLDARAVMLPLYLYDHSGLRMSVGGFSCPWDSGQVGWIYASREDVLKNWGWKVLTKERRERAERLLKSEVEEYDQFLCGDAWGWAVYETDDEDDCDCEPDDECSCTRHAFCESSCWGYYGVADALSEGKAHLEWLEKDKESE